MDSFEKVREFYKMAYKAKYGFSLSDQEADKQLLELHEKHKAKQRFEDLLKREVRKGQEILLMKKIDESLDKGDKETFLLLADEYRKLKESL